MKYIHITINAEPVAKGRAKHGFKNGATYSYTPYKTQEAQEELQATFQKKLKPIPAHTPLKLTIVFYRTKSKWLPKREDKPFRKPDLDNFLKLVMDAMSMKYRKYRTWENGAWRNSVEELKPVLLDDAQITWINVKKRWSHNGHGYIDLTLEDDILDK